MEIYKTAAWSFYDKNLTKRGSSKDPTLQVKNIISQSYFLIPSLIENNLIYLFITPFQMDLNQKTIFCSSCVALDFVF